MKLRHVVLFGFAEAVGAATISEVVRRFADLQTIVPGIDAFEWGENCSPEALNQGHSHAFVLTFASAEARDAYLVHPDHVTFAEWVRTLISTSTVVDYWVGGEGVSR